jgi:hypothetical protein
MRLLRIPIRFRIPPTLVIWSTWGLPGVGVGGGPADDGMERPQDDQDQVQRQLVPQLPQEEGVGQRPGRVLLLQEPEQVRVGGDPKVTPLLRV